MYSPNIPPNIKYTVIAIIDARSFDVLENSCFSLSDQPCSDSLLVALPSSARSSALPSISRHAKNRIGIAFAMFGLLRTESPKGYRILTERPE